MSADFGLTHPHFHSRKEKTLADGRLTTRPSAKSFWGHWMNVVESSNPVKCYNFIIVRVTNLKVVRVTNV